MGISFLAFTAGSSEEICLVQNLFPVYECQGLFIDVRAGHQMNFISSFDFQLTSASHSHNKALVSIIFSYAMTIASGKRHWWVELLSLNSFTLYFFIYIPVIFIFTCTATFWKYYNLFIICAILFSHVTYKSTIKLAAFHFDIVGFIFAIEAV